MVTSSHCLQNRSGSALPSASLNEGQGIFWELVAWKDRKGGVRMETQGQVLSRHRAALEVTEPSCLPPVPLPNHRDPLETQAMPWGRGYPWCRGSGWSPHGMGLFIRSMSLETRMAVTFSSWNVGVLRSKRFSSHAWKQQSRIYRLLGRTTSRQAGQIAAGVPGLLRVSRAEKILRTVFCLFVCFWKKSKTKIISDSDITIEVAGFKETQEHPPQIENIIDWRGGFCKSKARCSSMEHWAAPHPTMLLGAAAQCVSQQQLDLSCAMGTAPLNQSLSAGEMEKVNCKVLHPEPLSLTLGKGPSDNLGCDWRQREFSIYKFKSQKWCCIFHENGEGISWGWEQTALIIQRHSAVWAKEISQMLTVHRQV